MFNKPAVFSKTDLWRKLQIIAIFLPFMVLVTIWTVTLSRLQHEEKLVINNASVTQGNLAMIVSENLNQMLSRGELFKGAAFELLQAPTPAVVARIQGMLASERAFSRIAIFDAQGKLRYASSPSPQDSELLPLVRKLLRQPRSGAPHELTAGPMSSSLGEAWRLPLLFPLHDNQGRQTGILLLTLDLGYMLHLYQDIDIGDSGSLRVVLKDGTEIARARRAGLEIAGNPISLPPLTGPERLARGLIRPLAENGPPHLIAFCALDHYPFGIMADREVGDVMASYHAFRTKYLITVALLTLLVLAGTAGITSVLRRQREAFNALSASEQEKRQLILQLEEEKLRALQLASIDHLTGLANRRMFMELAASHLLRAKRGRKFSAFLFVDLDRFKSINDTLGHHVGDLLLQTVAARLTAGLRESDLIARLGGDEFIIMLNGLEHEEDITGIAEKIVQGISQPCDNLDGHDLQVYPSIGISIFPRDGQELEKLVQYADLAMYNSKQSKTSYYTFYDASLNTRNILQFDLDQRFPKALRDNEFVLHFQPKVDLDSFRIVGLEALIRWEHPEHGLIFPGEFIPLAENTGHIIGLGNWVVEAACRQIAAWKTQGVPTVPVAINVSASQLRDEQLYKVVGESLSRHGVDHGSIELEVTESSLMQNIEVASGILDLFSKAGVHIALDDFGNGFSSLGYIKSLPIHTIKIDRAFIRDIRNSHDDAVIVASTITLAHNLGMRVVAEGVESRDQLVHLKTAGCDEVQGYYFSRPLPAEKIGVLLKEVFLKP